MQNQGISAHDRTASTATIAFTNTAKAAEVAGCVDLSDRAVTLRRASGGPGGLIRTGDGGGQNANIEQIRQLADYPLKDSSAISTIDFLLAAL